MLITLLNFINVIVKPLCWIAVILLFAELLSGSTHSKEGFAGFLWAERVIAAVFMVEYGVRCLEEHYHPDNTPDYGFSKKDVWYPTSFLGIVDLLAWLPFVIGFFVPIEWLGLIRACRILRLLKFFRYSENLQIILRAFIKSWPLLKSLAFAMLIVVLFSSVVLFEIEKANQPEGLGKIDNALWYAVVTTTTIGYGDISPQTQIGKFMAVMILFIPGLTICAATVGVVSEMVTESIKESQNAKTTTDTLQVDLNEGDTGMGYPSSR